MYLPHFGWSTGPTYSSLHSRHLLYLQRGSFLWIKWGRTLVQRPETGCDCILQVYNKSYTWWHCLLPAPPFPPTMQDHLPKGLHKYFHKDKKMYLREYFTSAYQYNLVRNYHVITIYHALVCAVESPQSAQPGLLLDEGKCYRECSTDLFLLGYYCVLMQAQC